MAALAEIVARAEQLAVQRGIDPHRSQLADAGMTVEALYPHALRYAIAKDLREGGAAQNYMRSHDIVITDGVGILPDTVLREFLKSSFLPDKPYSSWAAFPDYNRDRFDNLLCYYTSNGPAFYTSCLEDPVIELVESTFEAVAGSRQIEMAVAEIVNADHIGKRFRMITDSIIVDAIIDEIVSTTRFTVFAKALLSSVLDPEPGEVLDTPWLETQTLPGISTTDGSATVTSSIGVFEDAHVGSRLYVPDGIDAIIGTVNAPNEIEMVGQAYGDTVDVVATLYTESLTQGIVLSTPSVPDVPADDTTDIVLSEKLLNDVILIMAAAVTGEMKLSELLNYR